MKELKKTEETLNTPDTSKEPYLKKLWNWSLNHFFKTFAMLFIINVLFFIFSRHIPWPLIIIAFLALTFYIIAFLIKRIHKNVNKLLHHELQFKEILIGYVTSVIFIVLLCSIMYWGMMIVGAGYLKYGSCTDTVEITREMIAQDPLTVANFWHYPYFSTITFFSVGYGDMCPMGMSKVIAMLNSIIGNAFTVLILAIAITNYSGSKEEKESKKRGKKQK